MRKKLYKQQQQKTQPKQRKYAISTVLVNNWKARVTIEYRLLITSNIYQI